MELMVKTLMPLSLCMIKRPAAKWQHLLNSSDLTSGVFLSSSTACLQGMPELSAVLIMVLRAPALINPHRVGLLIARLMACETAPVLPVSQTTFVMDLPNMSDTDVVSSPSL